MKYCIVYLASSQHTKLSTEQLRFDMLCKSIENTSTIFYDQDYLIFHEDLDDTSMLTIKNIYKNVYFLKLDFERKELDFKKYGRNKGYMLMCRFFSGELQKILIEKKYDSYIRFDDDSFLIEPFLDREKIEREMGNYDYIFRTIFTDGQPRFNNGIPMQSLFEFTKDFLKKKGYDYNHLIDYWKKHGFINNNGLYTGLAPYNNFHASKLSLWTHPLVNSYVDELIAINGCLMNFWMDANIHSMIIFLICPFINKKVHLKTDFGYRHNRHFSILNSPAFQYKSNEDFFPS